MIGSILLLISVAVLVLALSGAFTGIVRIIQNIKKMTKEEAKMYVREIIKDIYHKRSYFKLECTYFPEDLKNDLYAYLTPTEYEQWEKRFTMISQKGEESGTTPTGLPYYSFKLPILSEESIGIYESMIRTISKDMLNSGFCTETRVIVEWYPTNEKKYFVCKVIYARTASEQESFKRLAEYKDNRKLGITTEEVHDPELDLELSEDKENERDGQNQGRI